MIESSDWSDRWNRVRERLDRDGFAVWEDPRATAWAGPVLEEIERLFELEGERAGSEFRLEPGCRRLANLLDKSALIREVVLFEPVLTVARHVLGDSPKISSVNVRSVNPRSTIRQPLHADGGVVMDDVGATVFNAIWLLDGLTGDNGAIRVVPGSHLTRQLPQDALQDPLEDHPRQLTVTARPGSILLLNAHTWHGGLPNNTPDHRRTLHVFFTRRDQPQQQYQRRLLRPETLAQLNPELRRLLAIDDPENDRLCSQSTNMSGFLKS